MCAVVFHISQAQVGIRVSCWDSIQCNCCVEEEEAFVLITYYLWTLELQIN